MDEWFDGNSFFSMEIMAKAQDIVGDFDEGIKKQISLLMQHTRYWSDLWTTDFFYYILTRTCEFEAVMRWRAQSNVKELLRDIRKRETWFNSPQKHEIEWLKLEKFI